jgi:hypothetical protein
MGNYEGYEPVEDRLRMFWVDHPFGRIETELKSSADGNYIIRAAIYRESETNVAATGYAHDSVDTLPANLKNSALEVCETSAVGRALANLGYAPKGKRPSREEMQKSAGPAPADAGAGESNAAAETPSPANPGPTTVIPDDAQPAQDAGGPACPHLRLDPLKADGKPYPKGYARCLDCGDQGIRVAA